MKRKHFRETKQQNKPEEIEEESEHEKLERLRFLAARKIQSIFRGFIYRFHLSHLDYQHSAARKIQRAWRNHLINQRLQRLRELIALIKISRLFEDFNRKIVRKREYQRLQTFEPIMTFYPSKCKKPIPPKRRPQSKKGKKNSGKSELGRPIKYEPKGNKAKAARTSYVNNPKPAKSAKKGVYKSSGPPRKRTVFIDLPPPWHNKDARRISQTQQDELIYAQRNDIQWVKNELIPSLMRKINSELDLRDALIEKNEKFRTRMVTKPFISPSPRTPNYLIENSPQSINFLSDTGIYALGMNTGVIYSKIISYMDDIIFKREKFELDSPLFDIAIHPKSGYIIGLDHNWCVRLLNGPKTVLTKQLNPEQKIPTTKKFLHFDSFGFLWVNLIPQKGNLICLDPLTLEMTIQVNLENLAMTYKFIRQNINIIPLSMKEAIGFAGIFEGMSDVVLFSPDFSKSRTLRHPNMQEVPCIRKSTNKLLVWSADRVIYIYEIANSIEAIQLLGSFKVDRDPMDVCATSEPDLVYVSLDDCTLRAYLGGKSEYALRLPISKMTRIEQTFADSMLGPNTYTKSRPSFLLMSMHRFSSIPIHIDAWSMSPKLAMVVVTFSNASIHSIWFYNNSRQVKCDEFDKLVVKDDIDTQVQIVAEYKEEEGKFLKKRGEFLDIFNFLCKFDVNSNKGQLRNIFMPNAKIFSMAKFVREYSLHSIFQFVPEPKQYNEFSVYEVFHYLKRSGILPNKISEFGQFLTRFAPAGIHKMPQPEVTFNVKLPVVTNGLYHAVTDYTVVDRDISTIIEKINPLNRLKETLSVFTIAQTSINDQLQNTTEQNKISTQRRWISLYEKTELTKRLTALILLEDLGKHELMGRVQKNIDEMFIKNMYDKIVPIPSIDVHQHITVKEAKGMTFSEKPNRNPLLDQRMHRSIYHTWSTKTLFSRDRNISVDLRAIHVPNDIFLQVSVQNHFEMIKKVSAATKKITSEVYAVSECLDDTSMVVITEDSKALPLSHYLNIHSFLGANSRLILAARSILSRILSTLYQLHKSGIIVRTLIPDNILLNAQNGTVSIGNVFDCQQLASSVSRSIYLPFPSHFAHVSNPFLPPEYFHEPPRKWTTAFDVWQFGILLLYLLTGFLPKSYGSELLKHIDEEQKLKIKRVTINQNSILADPPVYPQCRFFYDWLKGCNVVLQGDRASWVSDSGECYITTDRVGIASILELDHYHLLPYKNTKIKYDESRLFLEIIASCLQVDPEKRPTVEQLLRTIPFNQANQIGDILDQYMRQPDSDIFVREFFTPTLDNLNDKIFDFALGIISALIFHDDLTEDDAAYSFPLDSRAAERVIESLFAVKFMDQLIIYVLNRVESKITYNEVNPSCVFHDDAFDQFLKLLERFVAAVDHGQGSLLGHVDEVIMTLLGLYVGNPRLRHSSQDFHNNPNEIMKLGSTGSAAVYVFTHYHLKQIVTYALSPSNYIFNALKRTDEHTDAYFNSFINFGEKVFAFANAMVHSIEKQRANAIYVLLQYWGNGSNVYVNRLFIDFRVPQMAIHCFLNSAAKVEASHFINECFNAIKLKSYDPTYLILQRIICQPTVYDHCSMSIRNNNEKQEMKVECLELIRQIMFGDNASTVAQLMIADVFWTLAENCRNPFVYNLLVDSICFSSKFVIQLIFSSSSLRKMLKANGVDLNPKFDLSSLNHDLTVEETLEVAKKFAATLFIRQSSLPIEIEGQDPPLTEATEFLIRSIKLALKESERAANNLDDKVLQSTRFDLKGTTYLKAKTTARNTDFSDTKLIINELCDDLLHLFRCLCFYWREPKSDYPKHLIDFILEMIISPIPECQSMPHPAYIVHHCIQEMALHCLSDLPEHSPIRNEMMQMQEIYPKVMLRDIMFVMHCIDKDIVEMQLITRYPQEKQIRMKMFMTIMLDRQSTNLSPILRFVVADMLHNRVQFNGDTILSQNYQYPIRSEAINMITAIVELRDKYESTAKRMADELVLNNFIDEEQKMTDNDYDQQLSSSSIMFLRTITQCNTIFDQRTLKPAKQLLEKLCMKYTREWMNISSFNATDDANPDKSKPKLSSQRKSQLTNMSQRKMIQNSSKFQLSQTTPRTPKSILGQSTPRKSTTSLHNSNGRSINVSRTSTPVRASTGSLSKRKSLY